MGTRLRSFNWAKTPLGPLLDWPQSLKTIVDLVLASQLGMNLIWGPERIQIYNDANRAFFGAKHPAALGRPFREVWSEIREAGEAIHRRVLAGESVTHENHPWVLMRNGRSEETFFTTYFTPIRDETGAVAGNLVTTFETTKAVNEKAALVASEARLKAAVELVGISPYSGDPRSGVLDWDARLKAMWGLPADAYVDMPMAGAAVHPDDQPRLASAWEASLDPTGTGAFIAEYRVRGIKDGVERWVSTHTQNFFEREEPIRFIGAVREITGEKRAEQALRDNERALRELTETLEERVVERTSALNAQIAERERLSHRLAILQTELFHATRVSTAGQMASQIAHEVNQPLTAAANSLGAARRLLKNEGDSEVMREVLDEARHEVLRAGQIIQRVRDFTRSGISERKAEDLAAVIEEASALVLAPTAVPRDGADFQIDAKETRVFVDRIQIVQVLVNLFRNALEAMEASQRQRLTVRATLTKAGVVEVSVADTGVGVAPESVDRLFEPFSSTKPGGMGLGLSICRSIVEAHGGMIGWAPNPGGGSEFRVTLPTDHPD
jgi:PAS domain S-box-containing protein